MQWFFAFPNDSEMKERSHNPSAPAPPVSCPWSIVFHLLCTQKRCTTEQLCKSLEQWVCCSQGLLLHRLSFLSIPDMEFFGTPIAQPLCFSSSPNLSANLFPCVCKKMRECFLFVIICCCCGRYWSACWETCNMFTWPGNVPAHLSGSFVLALLPILGLGFCHDCCELGFVLFLLQQPAVVRQNASGHVCGLHPTTGNATSSKRLVFCMDIMFSWIALLLLLLSQCVLLHDLACVVHPAWSCSCCTLHDIDDAGKQRFWGRCFSWSCKISHMLLFLLFLFAHVCNYFRLLLMRSRMRMRLQLRNWISELSYEHKLVTRRKLCWGHCHMAGVTKCLLILSLAETSKSHTTALTAAFMFVDTEPKLLMENILPCFHNL